MPTNAWLSILGLVKDGTIQPAEGAVFIETLLADVHQIAGGKDLTPDQVKNLASVSLPVFGTILGKIAPQAKPAIFVAGLILSHSHPMTFEEEQRWMDLKSGGPGH